MRGGGSGGVASGLFDVLGGWLEDGRCAWEG